MTSNPDDDEPDILEPLLACIVIGVPTCHAMVGAVVLAGDPQLGVQQIGHREEIAI